MSLTQPSVSHPATAADTAARSPHTVMEQVQPITDPKDPRVQWREYWSVPESRPYYHNLVTQEVSEEPPEGFPTRFGKHWVRSGRNVDTHGIVSEPPKPEEGAAKKTGLKARLAVYGAGGFLLYLIVHNIFLANIFVALYVFGIDLVSMAKEYGLSNYKRKEEMEMKREVKKHTFIGTFVTAVALNKMLVPIQVMITLALAPMLARPLTPMAQRASAWCRAKWNSRAAATNAASNQSSTAAAGASATTPVNGGTGVSAGAAASAGANAASVSESASSTK